MTEFDVHFEFPKDEADRQRLVLKHERKGRAWVSSALVDGRMRMKFASFQERKAERRLARYAGHENNGGRSEWDR